MTRVVWLRGVAVALAVLFPIHLGLAVGEGALNVSLGDPLVVAILAWAFVRTDHPPLPGRVDRLALLLALVALVSLAVPALQPGGSPLYFDLLSGVLGLVKLVAGVGWMLAAFVLVRQGGTPVLRAFAVATITSGCAWSAWAGWESLVAAAARPSGPFENPNLFGNYLLLGLSAVLVWAATASRPRSRLPWCAVPILSFGIAVTGSRGALLGLVVGWIAAAILHRRELVRAMRPAGFLAGCVLLAGTGWAMWRFWLTNDLVAERFSGLAEGTAPNVDSRLALLSSAWQAFLTHPLLGIGYQQFPAQYATFAYNHAHATHNTVLAAAAETGLVGLLLLGAFLVAVVGAIRVAAPVHRAVGGCAAFLAATAAQGLFTNVDNFRSLWLVTGAVLALAAGAPAMLDVPRLRPVGSA